MATFNYNSLKKITAAGIVDATITSAKFATDSVITAKIQDAQITTVNIADANVTGAKLVNASVTAAKLAPNAVTLNTSIVTGTLPISKGGTELTAVGAANRVLRVNNGATAYEYDFSDLVSIQIFNSTTTWSRPTGITRIRIQLVGPGGGGSGHGEAGGGGGFSERMLDVTSISSVAVTVGTGGGGVNYHNVAGGGSGATSFGPYLSASAGEGGRNIAGHSGGRPGIGSGGTMNLYGGGGSGHINHGGGEGGSSYFGGSAIGVHANSPHTYDQETQAAPGSGGTGGARDHGRGANGRNGMVIVWEYK
jgi:hypothetical protein